MRGWEYLGSGRHRAVFRRGNYVTKVPMNVEGVLSNQHEARTW